MNGTCKELNFCLYDCPKLKQIIVKKAAQESLFAVSEYCTSLKKIKLPSTAREVYGYSDTGTLKIYASKKTKLAAWSKKNGLKLVK